MHLLVQLFAFLLPAYIWKNWESEEKGKLVGSIESLFDEDGKVNAKIIGYMCKKLTCVKRFYGLKYMFCELLCLANLIGQILFMDWYLGGGFLLYGVNALNRHSTGDPRLEIFPVRTNCKYILLCPIYFHTRNFVIETNHHLF